ncbi:MAG TPA: phage portal protein [Aquabacterium sp.]|nr:phage portal protein [Aquabacterium sp.]
MKLWPRIVSWFIQQPQTKPAARQRMQSRMYAAAKASRLTNGFAYSNQSSDAELCSSLTQLRARSRQLVRDANYAKRAKVIIVNNVIGWSGVGMQCQIKTNAGKLVDRQNDEIEQVWGEWCEADSCHTGGRLHFAHIERQLMAQVFEAGEAFVRLHFRRFGGSKIPLALEVIEAERLADEFSQPGTPVAGNEIRMGVEVDSFHRPVAYWIREKHPGDIRWTHGTQGSNRYERVPAEFIIHLAVIDRWPQTRGEPWLHTAARKMNDMDGYVEAEIVRARAQASMSGFIKTEEGIEELGEIQPDGSAEMETEPGVFKKLYAGEEVQFPNTTAPNPAMDPFMCYMLREVAAGIGISYESLSGDYSKSNYSSSRMGLLDSRDIWRFFQWWFIRDFRQRLHKVWMTQAMMAGAITSVPMEQWAVNPRKYEAVRYKPRGWTWVDPTKEVAAYEQAIKAGFTTLTDVIAQTAGGDDIEDLATRRESELDLLEDKELVFTTSPQLYAKPDAAPPHPAPPEADPEDPDKDQEPPQAQNPPPRRVLSFGSKQ